MRTRIMLCTVLLFSVLSCATPSPDVIHLSGGERTQAIVLAEHRQDIAIRRQQAQNDYTAAINRLNEEESNLNILATQLCFQLKKAHALDPGTNYQLDEYKGQLVKQK